MPEITRISKKFTYNIADQYLYQTNDLKRTAEWTYEGPDKLWIFVNNETNKINSRFHYTERDNGAEVPTPVGLTKVLVDCNVNPLLGSLLYDEKVYGDLPHTVENLPEGNTYGHPDPIPPDHTYELIEIEYNPVTGSFKEPYPWKKPHMTWERLLEVRNNMLLASDYRYAQATTEEKKAEWETYRQKLRDISTTYEGIDPWKVPFPQEPSNT